MLNKSKIVSELNKIVISSLENKNKEIDLLKYCANLLISNNTSYSHLFNLIYTESINTSITLAQSQFPYSIMGIDGSQIYPDRHQSCPCYLINIGWVKILYNTNNFFTEFDSLPNIFNNSNFLETEDSINLQRTELEFNAGLEHSIKLKNQFKDIPFLLLFDGSLIAWHLENKNPEIKKRYLTSYLQLLEGFHKHQINIASVISLSQSKDLINLINQCIANKILPNSTAFDYSFKYVCDIDFLLFFLKPFTRSAFFSYTNNVRTLQDYPDHLKPNFVYLCLREEIIRIELPAWLMKNTENLNVIINIILDQSLKGQGYPVVLSEAHEQAVVKSSDRDFFYQLLFKMNRHNQQKITYSQKSLKKKLVAV